MIAGRVPSPDRLRSPALRHMVWRVLYGTLARRFPTPQWTFMNYGYQAAGEAGGGSDDATRAFAALYERVAAPAGPLAGRDVVEVGSGRGGGARWMAQRAGARSVLGIDPAPAAVALSRALHRDVRGVRFETGTADAIPCEAASADRVMSVESCQHYPSIDGFLAECERVLRPGGWLCVASYLDRRSVKRWTGAVRRSGLVLEHAQDLSRGVLRAVAATETFKHEMMERHAPAPWRPLLRHFAGVRGSWLDRGLTDGSVRYLGAALRRPR